MLNRFTQSPYALAVILSLGLIALVFIWGGSIAGCYILGVHYANTLAAKQAALAAKQLAIQKHAAIASCTSFHSLAAAGNGIHFPAVNAAHPSELALTRLFAGIHNLYTSSGCPQILKGIFPK